MEAGTHPQQGGAQPPAEPDDVAASKNQVVLRTLYPIDEFVHGVGGAEPITSQGTPVAKSKVKQIEKAAEQNDVRLEEVKDA